MGLQSDSTRGIILMTSVSHVWFLGWEDSNSYGLEQMGFFGHLYLHVAFLSGLSHISSFRRPGLLTLRLRVIRANSMRDRQVEVTSPSMTWLCFPSHGTLPRWSPISWAVTKAYEVSKEGVIDPNSWRRNGKVQEEHVGYKLLLWPFWKIQSATENNLNSGPSRDDVQLYCLLLFLLDTLSLSRRLSFSFCVCACQRRWVSVT